MVLKDICILMRKKELWCDPGASQSVKSVNQCAGVRGNRAGTQRKNLGAIRVHGDSRRHHSQGKGWEPGLPAGLLPQSMMSPGDMSALGHQIPAYRWARGEWDPNSSFFLSFIPWQ